MHRGSRVRSPPVPVVLSAYQRGSLLDGLAMYLSCDTKKSHDNESTDIIFGRPPIGGEASPFSLAVPLRESLYMGQVSSPSESVAGPRMWNDLPPGLRRPGLTFDSFRQSRKPHLLGDRSA